MFHEAYPYHSSGSVVHARALRRRIAKRLLTTELTGPDPFVVEIGCNDGIMLEEHRRGRRPSPGRGTVRRGGRSGRGQGHPGAQGLLRGVDRRRSPRRRRGRPTSSTPPTPCATSRTWSRSSAASTGCSTHAACSSSRTRTLATSSSKHVVRPDLRRALLLLHGALGAARWRERFGLRTRRRGAAVRPRRRGPLHPRAAGRPPPTPAVARAARRGERGRRRPSRATLGPSPSRVERIRERPAALLQRAARRGASGSSATAPPRRARP